MSLVRLEIQGLRNLEATILEPGPRLNFVVGPNASGKSSLLEAVNLLGRAKSFRTPNNQQVIKTGERELIVAGRIRDEEDRIIPLGVRIGRNKRELHLDGQSIPTRAPLLNRFPLIVIQPAGISLLEGTPKFRRSFINLGVFYRDSDYLGLWKRYVRVLHHRNTLLKTGRTREIEPWSHELARCGIMVANAWTDYIDQLRPYLKNVCSRFFESVEFDIRVHPGWDPSVDFEAALRKDLMGDIRYGHTQSGPHKGDLVIELGGKAVKSFLSRGQMKLLVYSLLLAQAGLMEANRGRKACVLIDDVASELDQNNRDRLLQLIQENQSQFFVSATDRETISQVASSEAVLFEIKNGQITRAITES